MGSAAISRSIPLELGRVKIKNIISLITGREKYSLRIPYNIYLRTNILCEYIADQVEENFSVADFLYYLYQQFTFDVVHDYNPKKILNILQDSKKYNEKIIIAFGGDEEYVYDKRDCSYATIEFSIDRDDTHQGKLILREIEDLYRVEASFDTLITNLWILFIESYKMGTEKKALKEMIIRLKEMYE